YLNLCFFFSSRRRHTRSKRDWSSDVCSSDLSVVDGYQGHMIGAGPIQQQLRGNRGRNGRTCCGEKTWSRPVGNRFDSARPFLGQGWLLWADIDAPGWARLDPTSRWAEIVATS